MNILGLSNHRPPEWVTLKSLTVPPPVVFNEKKETHRWTIDFTLKGDYHLVLDGMRSQLKRAGFELSAPMGGDGKDKNLGQMKGGMFSGNTDKLAVVVFYTDSSGLNPDMKKVLPIDQTHDAYYEVIFTNGL